MRTILTTLFLLLFGATIQAQSNKAIVDTFLNQWHEAAGNANFEAYFEALDENSIYIGTDATENWTKKEFANFAKPYFDKGKAWNFKTLERSIYFSPDGTMAWFDELLNTQMKICRGSGVLVQKDGKWKIKHYVLSMTIPNETVSEVVKSKSTIEDLHIQQLQNANLKQK